MARSPASVQDTADIEESRRLEKAIYVRESRRLYASSLASNGPLYDLTATATNNFTEITAEAIQGDTRILKILRYCIAPSISQMKFGQLFGLRSTASIESRRHGPGSSAARALASKATEVAAFIRANLDQSRFEWATSGSPPESVALAFAKSWTCSISADQNAQTAYRNGRKKLQESAISDHLRGKGYSLGSLAGILHKKTLIPPGQFLTEKKVRGRTVQKADLVVRSRSASKALILIEAKAVGVELDAIKRVKECCDKAHDWCSSSSLRPQVVAVIAGFFTETTLANLRASHVRIVWEHRLSDLDAYL
jgi:hypothetical protein